MLTALIDYNRCAAHDCAKCEARLSCVPRAIIKIDSDEPAAIEVSQCLGCGDCVLACPAGAISMADI